MSDRFRSIGPSQTVRGAVPCHQSHADPSGGGVCVCVCVRRSSRESRVEGSSLPSMSPEVSSHQHSGHIQYTHTHTNQPPTHPSPPFLKAEPNREMAGIIH